ncbi:hypothetical protein KM043_005282 [Ampulex compressa]|nr:hypothetical protein KM043_005282 [Ampulex compressa]
MQSAHRGGEMRETERGRKAWSQEIVEKPALTCRHQILCGDVPLDTRKAIGASVDRKNVCRVLGKNSAELGASTYIPVQKSRNASYSRRQVKIFVSCEL